MHKVVVAGIPRSGTSLIYLTICHSIGDKNVVKTHSLAPPEKMDDPYQENTEAFIANGAKALFVFGDPVLSVISTRKSVWNDIHARNCGFFGKLKDANIYKKDIFNYERMFDSWMKPHKYPVFAVKYMSMYKYFYEICDFLGCKLIRAEFRERQTQYGDVSEQTLKIIQKTYASLIEKVKCAPEARIWR